jgi:multidrug efflux pump subunit AcrA (membrane-fusion protein)
MVDEDLARTRIEAPFAGAVVSGDLEQALGAPVARGDVLFELAPLDSYRVILEVDERDVAHVRADQHGQLRLTSMPGRSLSFELARVTPVSEVVDGRNVFRVEARLTSPSEELRPGMEGVGKIEAGSRSLLWIWTHEIGDWLRLALWRWTP